MRLVAVPWHSRLTSSPLLKLHIHIQRERERERERERGRLNRVLMGFREAYIYIQREERLVYIYREREGE